jgi:multidrug efflux pump subunit AcrB
MLQPTASMDRVMVVGLSSKTLSLIQMSVLARWTIVPRLMGVPGAANVAIWGQRDRQLQAQVDPRRLKDNKVSLLDVLETTGNTLWVSTSSFVEASRLAVLASMLMALTVTPALCLILLAKAPIERHEAPLVDRLLGFAGDLFEPDPDQGHSRCGCGRYGLCDIDNLASR